MTPPCLFKQRVIIRASDRILQRALTAVDYPPFTCGKELQALANFAEYRMRQTTFDRIVIEFGGRSELSANEVAGVKSFLKQRAGPDSEIEVKPCEQIDWGKSRKKPGFRCEV